MPDRFDVVVAGAGHNSLIAAAYLAKAGYRCLVLEGRSVVGGNCVTEELTLPGLPARLLRHGACRDPGQPDAAQRRARACGLRAGIHPSRDRRAHAVPGRQLADAVPRHRAHLRRVRQILQEGCRRLPAHDRRIRRDQADVRCRLLHADRLRQADQRAARRASRRQEMAAPHRDVGLGDHPRQFRGRSLPRRFMLWMAFQTVVPPEWPMTGRLAYSLGYGRQRWSWCVPKGGSGGIDREPGAADRSAWRRRC